MAPLALARHNTKKFVFKVHPYTRKSSLNLRKITKEGVKELPLVQCPVQVSAKKLLQSARLVSLVSLWLIALLCHCEVLRNETTHGGLVAAPGIPENRVKCCLNRGKQVEGCAPHHDPHTATTAMCHHLLETLPTQANVARSSGQPLENVALPTSLALRGRGGAARALRWPEGAS